MYFAFFFSLHPQKSEKKKNRTDVDVKILYFGCTFQTDVLKTKWNKTLKAAKHYKGLKFRTISRKPNHFFCVCNNKTNLNYMYAHISIL